MGNDELINFIQLSRGKGRTDEQIMRALLSVGWKKERITTSFAKIKSGRLEDFTQTQPAEVAQAERAPAAQPQQIQPTSQPQVPPQPVQPKPSPQTQAQVQKQQEPISLETQKKPLFTFPKLFGKKETQPISPASQAAPLQPQAQVQLQSPPQQTPTPAQMQQPAQPQAQAPAAAPQPLPAQDSLPQIDSSPSSPYDKGSSFSGVSKYLRILVTNKILLLAAAIILLAIVIFAAYFIVFAKGAAAGAASASQPPPLPPAAQNVQEAGRPENLPAQPPEQNNTTAPGTSNQAPPAGKNETPTNILPPPPEELSDKIDHGPQPEVQEIRVVIVPENPPEENKTVTFSKFSRFTSTGPTVTAKFCATQNNGTLYRVHYKGYYGAECISEKPGDEGFANLTFIYEKCTFLPCCISSDSKASSQKFDWFECGYP